jgi:hypothetical protein
VECTGIISGPGGGGVECSAGRPTDLVAANLVGPVRYHEVVAVEASEVTGMEAVLGGLPQERAVGLGTERQVITHNLGHHGAQVVFTLVLVPALRQAIHSHRRQLVAAPIYRPGTNQGRLWAPNANERHDGTYLPRCRKAWMAATASARPPSPRNTLCPSYHPDALA